jgi:uncharacterized pyridoxal phosphate-containing UPF0001 family protein
VQEVATESEGAAVNSGMVINGANKMQENKHKCKKFRARNGNEWTGIGKGAEFKICRCLDELKN